jgi:para-nitrobenzyl esterase
MISLAACVAMAAAPAWAQSIQPPTAAPAATPYYSTEETTVGDLLGNPATKAVVGKHVPEIVQNDQIQQARDMTLRGLQQYAGDSLSDEILDAIDKDLAAIPAPKP